MVQHWQKGFWELLAFSMQKALIVVTGYAFATAPAVARLLARVAAVPKNSVQAAALVAFVSSVAGLLLPAQKGHFLEKEASTSPWTS